jgi:hypothetical protein
VPADSFREAMERGRAKGRISMRRAQLRMLENGNATMGIWLGKQYLGQSDEFGINTPGLVVIAGCISPNRITAETATQIAGVTPAEETTLDITPED